MHDSKKRGVIMSKKKFAVAIISAILEVFALLWYFGFVFAKEQDQPPPNSLPDYSEEISIRITGREADGLGEGDVEQLMVLCSEVGKILYDVDEEDQPVNPGEWLRGATPEYLRSLAAASQVNSRLLESMLLDIRMEEPDDGNLLVCYRLEFESNQKERGEYLFLVNLQVSRTDESWICNEAATRGSALAMDYTLSRDDLSGNIRLKPIIEEEKFS